MAGCSWHAFFFVLDVLQTVCMGLKPPGRVLGIGIAYPALLSGMHGPAGCLPCLGRLSHEHSGAVRTLQPGPCAWVRRVDLSGRGPGLIAVRKPTPPLKVSLCGVSGWLAWL